MKEPDVISNESLQRAQLIAIAVCTVLVAVFVVLYGTNHQFEVKRYLVAIFVVLPPFIHLISKNSLIPVDVFTQGTHSQQHSGSDVTEYLYELFAKTPSPVFMKDTGGGYLAANDVFCDLAGVNKNSVLYKTDYDLFPDEVAKLFLWQDQQVIEHNRLFEFEETLPLAGELRTFITLKFPIHDNKGEIYAVGGHCTDITERKKALLALTESEQKYKTTMDSCLTGIFVIRDEKVAFINTTGADYFGYTPDEIIDTLSVFDIIHESDHDKVRDKLSKRMRGIEGKPYELKCLKKDGTTFNAMIWANPVRINGVPCSAGTILDITEQKLLEAELRRAHHIESIGTLAAGIAHDYNNVLSAILGNLRLARRLTTDQEELDSILEDAEIASNRASGLSRQLITFASGETPAREVASLADLVNETAEFILQGKNRLKLHIADDLWLTSIDTTQMSQVIQNLLLNAKQSMGERDFVEIQLENLRDFSIPNVHAEKNNYVKMTVRNTGPGIAKEHLPNVFDPYFTTKEHGHGLGLATSYSIIKRHGGHITVDSIENQETTFTIFIPATFDIPKRETKMKQLSTYSGRILLMDDDQMIREVGMRTLREFGYEVVTAASGEEAIEQFTKLRNEGTPVDLTIMDLTIPGKMGGKEAVKKFLEIDSTAKVIVSSGYSHDPIMMRFREFGFVAAASKPIDFIALADEIGNLISKTDS